MSAPLVVISVKGNDTVRRLLEPEADALAGRAVLNLTDGTSAEAGAIAEWVTAQGVGHPDSVVFYGGSAAVHEHHLPVLELLGGHGTFTGTDPGVPTLFGMAVHGTRWGALNGFLHAAALPSGEGIGLTRFLEQAGPAVAALPAHLPYLAGEIDRGAHAAEYGGLRHRLPSVEDLPRESRERGIDSELPAHTRELVAEAVADGHGDDSYSRLVEHFRRPAR